MKAKIDLDKFVCSLVKRYYEKIHIDPTTTRCWLDSVLEDQGLEYKDGEIVEIEQEQPYNKPLFFEKGKWYTCIAKVDGFKVGHTYQSKMDGTVSNDSGAMYMYHNDVNLIFRPATEEEILYEPSWAKTSEGCKHDALEKGEELRKWLDFGKTHEGTTITIPKDLKGTDTDGGVVGERGERPTDKNFRERYENIAKSDWFKKTHKDISIGEEQPTEEEMVGMGGLGKVWKEQAIISRLDRIIELLERPIIMPFSQPIQPLQPIYYDTNKVYCDTANTEGG